MSESPDAHLSVITGMISAMFVTWLIMRQAGYLDKWIGEEGALIITKLLGFLLAALAVKLVVVAFENCF
jgi:multiple antibiotic resistance protein